jgi:GNAT superfamily N-acetyltransferase
MNIEPFGPDDTDVVAEVVELQRAVQAVDSPWVHPSTVTTYTGMLRYGWDGEAPRAFVARDESGTATGTALYWVSEWDNQDFAWVDLVVHPDHRRRGIGRQLFEAMVDRAREEGRTKIGTDGWESESTRAFADAMGMALGSQAINRRQYLADMDRDVLAKLHDEAVTAAEGYELLRVVGAVPDDLIDAVVEMTAAINDAPTDDLEIEDEVFTAERVRGYEQATTAKGQRIYHLIARHKETGELAGHTVVAVENERPTIGHQHDTSVVRAHRGHRLGLLLKTEMLRWLTEAEPQLASIDTWNTETNDHMISVNEQLGYTILGRGLEFQRRL